MDNCDVLLEEANPLFHIRKWMFIEGFKVLRLVSVKVDRFLLKQVKNNVDRVLGSNYPTNVHAVLPTVYICSV